MNFKCNFRWYTKKLENNRTEKKNNRSSKSNKKQAHEKCYVDLECVCLYICGRRKKGRRRRRSRKTNEKCSLCIVFFLLSFSCYSNSLIIDTHTHNNTHAPKWHFCDCISTTWNPLVSPRKWLWFRRFYVRNFFLFSHSSVSHSSYPQFVRSFVRTLARRRRPRLDFCIENKPKKSTKIAREQCQKMLRLRCYMHFYMANLYAGLFTWVLC